MNALETLGFAIRSLTGARARSLLVWLAMSIAVASVVILTALGEGARRYVVDQFAQLGTHLLIVLPGRTETTGGAPPLLGETPRDLTLDDAAALLRSRHIERIAPLAVGNAPVSVGAREREVIVIGSTADFLRVRHLQIAHGNSLPAGEIRRGENVAVLGAKLKRELFGAAPALGEWVRIGDRRLRVIGVLADSGESLGMNTGDIVVIPVATAQALFDQPSLFRILVQARSREAIPAAKEAVLATIRARHDGEDDVTVITQDALLGTFNDILAALTYTVGGIGAISLVVAGILIMNVMLVTVAQRRGEIGLLKALGASRRRVLSLILVESILLAAIGALSGLVIAYGAIQGLRWTYPDFPLTAPLWAAPLAVAIALLTGVLFGVLPARRAADLDPVQALARR